MKKLYFLFFTLFTITVFSQDKLSKLDKSDMQTSVLFPSFPLVNLSDYQDNLNSEYSFYQTYKMIAENDLQNRFSSVNVLKTEAKVSALNNIVSLAVLNSDYEFIKEEAYTNNIVTLDSEGFLVKSNTQNPSSIYKKENITILAPLRLKHKGLNVTFNLPESNIFNASEKIISTIQVDFGNNEGFKTVTPNTNITVDYISPGNRKLNTVITFSDGSQKTSEAEIKVTYSNSDLLTLFGKAPSTFQSKNTTAPNLTPYAELDSIGTGEYEIFYSADGVLDKPIFLIDGFDPGDGRPINGYTDTTDPTNPVYVNGIYDLLNFTENTTTENLADVVRAEGFDVVILNFPEYTRDDLVEVDGGADFIERNAMLLVELIGIINTMKTESGNDYEENVIIGPSMGGLISRFALNFMENQSLDHDTRLWMSIDSPHLGANVPIGFQYLFNKLAYGLQLGGLAGDQSVESIRPLVDGFLKSPAARQMLVDHFEAHITSGTNFDSNLMLPQKHPWSNMFFNGDNGATGINNLTPSGFPENLRKVSLINGSGSGNAYPDKLGNDVTPDFLALNVSNLNIGSGATANFTTKYTPTAGLQSTISTIFINTPWYCFCGNFNASATIQAESFTDGVDAAYGGLFDIGGLTGSVGSDPLIDSFLAGLTTDYFNFIPTVSSMALSNQPNYYTIPNPNNGDPLNETPFDAWYMPVDNEGHVSLNTANVNFALDEIIIRASVSAKVVLQGAALNPNTGEENLMRDDLRVNGLLPIVSPYSDALVVPATIFNLGGTSGTGLPEDDIVDWVWVELRDANDNTSVLASQSALLQRDGDIVGLDGLATVNFNIPGTTYYVAIKHRNHLSITSSSPIALSRITSNINFSDANNPITFGSNAQTSFGMPNNVLGMWAGNVNGDTVVQYSGTNPDASSILSNVLNDAGNFLNLNTFVVNGYNVNDVDLSGASQYAGTTPDTPYILQNTLYHPGNVLNLSTFEIQEQLPEN